MLQVPVWYVALAVSLVSWVVTDWWISAPNHHQVTPARCRLVRSFHFWGANVVSVNEKKELHGATLEGRDLRGAYKGPTPSF
ncbi:hypothetical protein GE21DRAFT_1284893 [Neurospora crassa]|nr:hypothetical protein GE21DRAFT_1284893 [Neurospora crassa]